MIDRVTRIERIFDNLTIRGPGWSGDSEQGFMFNPIAHEAAPVQFGCIPITLTFSGIIMNCGCQEGTISTDVSVNGAFNLTSCVQITGSGTEWSTIAGGTVHQDFYGGAPLCTGGVFISGNAQLQIDVQFILATNTWIVNYAGSAVTASIFVLQGSGVSPTLPVTITNSMSCGTTGGFPGGFFAGFTSIAGGSLFGFGSGHGGSVTISRT